MIHIGNYSRYNKCFIYSHLSRINLKKYLFTQNIYNILKPVKKENINDINYSKQFEKEPENIDINDINYSKLFWEKNEKWKF